VAECTDDLGFWFALGRFAISDHNIYGLFVSTHYPSDVTADGGGPVYYHQVCTGRVILQIVPEHGLIRMAVVPRGGPCLVLEDRRSTVVSVIAHHRVIPLLAATLTAA